MKTSSTRLPDVSQGDELELLDGPDCMHRDPHARYDLGDSTRSNLGQIRIDPNSLYRPSWLRRSIGKRCFEELRRSGLSKIGGWYLGKLVLEALEKTLEKTLDERRFPARTSEDKVSKGRRRGRADEAADKKRMGPDLSRGNVQPLSVNPGGESLREQINRYTRQTEKKVLVP